MILNNHSLAEYKLCRNTILFTWKEKNNIKLIVNNHIINIIQFFEQFIIIDDAIFNIQANEYNCAITIIKSNILEFNNIDNLFNIVYLKINDVTIKNGIYKDIIKNEIITRQICTFHQTDDNIKSVLYDVIIDNVNNAKQLILLGGEMYIFAKILKYDKLICYSDFQSIVDDTKDNLKTSENIFLVDYDDFTFSMETFSMETFSMETFSIEDDAYIVANTGKTGLNINICNNIIKNKNKIKKIIIISCNEKSFIKDYNYLMKFYKLINKIIIGYVTLNIMELIYD
jgi:hypothetical protein